MNFLKLAYNNVLRNIKAYFAYFLSSSISAALLFSFSMFVFHPDLDLSSYPKFIARSFDVTIVIAYIFLVFFVFYSVSVFLKGRYKEFGTLYILGISNKQIRKMIFIENIIISTISAIVGIVVGLVFSKIFLIVASKLLDLRPLNFYIPVKAIIINLIAFILLGVLISAFTSVIVKENEVLKLLKGTSAPKQEPKTSIILAIMSIALLVVGYYMAVTTDMNDVLKTMLPITIMVIAATYFLFSQLSVYVIKLLKKNRNFYMKKTTVLWVSNLFYKIKDNTRIFFLISITSAVAFTAIGASYACWRDKQEQVEEYFPQSIYYSVMDKAIENEKVKVLEDSLNEEKIKFTTLQGEFKSLFKENSKLKMYLISESTYKELSKASGQKTIDFKSREALVVAPIKKKYNKTVVVNNNEVNISAVVEKRILPALYDELYVIKDSWYDSITSNASINRFYAFNVNNYGETLNLSKVFENKYESSSDFKFISRAVMLDNNKIIYGVLILLAVFVGIIFFVTTGSFIYNKLYMEREMDKKKYKQLNKIGLTYKEIKKISTIEIGVLFLLPYIVASIHSLFAMIMVKNVFKVKVSIAAFLVMGSFLLIQVIYFLVIREKYLVEIKSGLVD